MQHPPRRSRPRPDEMMDIPAEVRDALQNAARRLEPLLPPASRRGWTTVALALVRNGASSGEAVAAYWRASPEMAAALTPRRFLRWARLGLSIAGESESVAAAFYETSPAAILYLEPLHIEPWAGLGLRLCRATDAGAAVACRFFEASPHLLQHGTLGTLAQIARVLEQAGPRAPDLSAALLNLTARLCVALPEPDLAAFLSGCEQIARDHGAALRQYFDAGLTLYVPLAEADRPRYLRAIERLALATPSGLSASLMEAAWSFGPILEAHGAAPLETLARLAELSTAGARQYLRNIAAVAGKLTPAQLAEWCRVGEALLATQESAGISFFQLQSREALEALTAVTPAVELAEVREVLRMYCQALMGKTVAIVAAEQAPGHGGALSMTEGVDWEGAAIFCPARMQEFPTKDGNFEAYKVLATHQAGHLEFGTFAFTFAGAGALLTPLRQTLARLLGKDRTYYTEFEQFFDLFAGRRLAQDLFTIAEDTRIDRQVRGEYRGIRHAFGRVQAHSAGSRPDHRHLPLRQQFVEMLLRMSLGAAPVVDVPEELAGGVATAAGLVNLLAGGLASVEDAAEATLRLYVVLSRTPNVNPDEYRDQPWVTLDLAEARYDPLAEDGEQIVSAFLEANQQRDRPQEDYEPMPPVVHRGDLTPDMQQALLRLQRQTRHLAQLRQSSGGDDQDGLSELSDEELLALVQDYIGLDDWLEDWEGEAGGGPREEMSFTREDALRILRGQREQSRHVQAPHVGEDEVQITLYDEWDYRAKAYRPKWCQVRQRRLREGGGAFYDETLARRRWLVHAVRQQFEMLRPENFGRVKRLQDGEEFDLDAVIEAHVEMRAGRTPSDKIYWRRNKTDRSVAVALLVDLSSSTGEGIEGNPDRPARDGGSGEAAPMEPKRIIDLERESVVLFIEALEQIGDIYGIYGFSGSGREDVQFYTIKEMQESLSDRVRRRVDQIAPLQGTRMGPAIRHATAKLERTEAKTKVLILLSDGRPQDRDYGALPWEQDALPRSFQRFDEYGPGTLAHAALMLDEKEYAVHDTKQALTEARSKGVTPFCISVDKQGRDYLRAMCGDIGYEVVSDIQSLPRRLPALYKQLTT